MSQIRVGLITTMSADPTWAQHFIDTFTQNHREAERALRGLRFEVVTASAGLGRTMTQMAEQARTLREKRVDVLVIYVPDWSHADTAAVAGLNSEVPVIVWSDAHREQNGITGAAIVRGGLDEVGVKTKLVHGRPDDPGTLRKLSVLCRGIAAATRLRNTKIGVGGSRCMGMVTTHADGSELLRSWGVDIDGWEQVDLLRRAQNVSESETRAMIEWLHRDFGRVEAKEEVVHAQVRMYLALLDLIKEKQYDAVCVKCLPELPACHTTFCLPIAILNDRSDHRGKKESVVCGCEADIGGTITMQILKTLNDGPTMFTDVAKLYYETNEVGLSNCGSSATEFARSRKEVFWVPEGLKEFQWKMGSACPQYVTRDGRVTLARLSRIAGEYVMLLAAGQSTEYPREKLKEINNQHPQTYVKLDCSLEGFLEELRCNHIHLVMGDFLEELKVAAWVLGVRAIIPA